MLPADWAALAPLLDRVLDAPAADRASVASALCPGDSSRAEELLRLAAECERPMPLLERPALERFARLADGAQEPALPAVLGGRYRIERELGRGGMARVVLARDLKHARDVAVKVIRPDLAESLGRDRFLQEIAIAARLRHPNIMPLYDSGDADGVLYFVMPYEAGMSLKTRLADGEPVPLGDAVNTLRDIARALTYAHAQGVVHRDVKPDNVMLSGGAAVVTDFGIAKAITAAQTLTGAGSLTQTGVVIGTPAYMSPEQATGDPATDHRTDIYAFGCLAYELLAGKPPFPGTSSHQVIAAQISAVPPSVSEVRSDVNAGIANLVAQCLLKDPAARPQSASELVDRLDPAAVYTAPDQPSPGRAPRRPRYVGAALILAIVTGLVATGWRMLANRLPDTATIAVLPLSSVGGDSLQSLMAEGFGDDVAAALVKFPWVGVKSRRGVGNYRGQRDLNIEAVGKALGVRYLIIGSFRQISERMTVQLQLVRTADGSAIWAEQFDGRTELSGLRDDIAKTIGDSLRPRARDSSPAIQGAGLATRRLNNDAYRLYLVGQRKFEQRGQSIGESIELFRQAIALDSLSAEANAGLSVALALSPYFNPVSTDAVAPEATASARRALRLDPTLAQPHVGLGLLAMYGRAWDAAGREFTEAIRLDAHNVEARIQYGRFLLFRDRIAEALHQFQVGRDEDPASAIVAGWTAQAHYLSGRLDSAQSELGRAMQIGGDSRALRVGGALILLAAGRKAEARRLVANESSSPTLYVLAATEGEAEAREHVRTWRPAPTGPQQVHTTRAFGYFGLGDTTRALEELEAATNANENWPSMQPVRTQIFDRVRHSSRFKALLRRVGLPDNIPSVSEVRPGR